MRIIKERTLLDYVNQVRYKVAREAVQVWMSEVRYYKWTNPAELKVNYRSASIIGRNRVVFNIKGNEFRLVVDVIYRYGIIYVIWFGSHAEYDKINVKKIKYGD